MTPHSPPPRNLETNSTLSLACDDFKKLLTLSSCFFWRFPEFKVPVSFVFQKKFLFVKKLKPVSFKVALFKINSSDI